MIRSILILGLVALSLATTLVGTGIADVTGGTAQIGMMGYAKEGQNTAGLHFRQRARAYVFVNEETKKRVALVSTDTCMTFSNNKADLISRLKAKYGDLYTEDNVLMTAIHNHGGPGAFSKFTLYAITTLGYDAQTADAIADGTFNAIVAAHEALSSGHATLAVSTLFNSSINRSPTSYLLDPIAERQRYVGDVDHTFQLVHLTKGAGDTKSVGSMAWFAVHCTSMPNTNKLITGDNKGAASMGLEAVMNGPGSRPGRGDFVGAFFGANLGDVSPNTAGAFCPDGTPCGGTKSSTCNGRNEGCQGKGPGGDDWFKSTKVIGERQTAHALEMLRTPQQLSQMDLDVDSRLIWAEMNWGHVPANFSHNGLPGNTCPAALGEGFAAGTTDGPGAFNFVQGNTTMNPFWTIVRDLLADPTDRQRACQHPKPIFLDLGEIKPSHGVAGFLGENWAAHALPFQVVRLSADPPVLVCGVPGELTTMSGRRVRAAVQKAYSEAHNRAVRERNPRARPLGKSFTPDEVTVMISGLANQYSHYVTTPEEFVAQRYEAASTLYGINTLGRHMFAYTSLAQAIARGDSYYPDGLASPAPEIPKTMPSFIPPVVLDEPPIGKHFGELYKKPSGRYAAGSTVSCVFYGANPRNSLKPHPEYGYLVVTNADTGAFVADDSYFSTKMEWAEETLSTHSYITITWSIPEDITPGHYKITHFGVSHGLFGEKTPYQGSTDPFAVSTR